MATTNTKKSITATKPKSLKEETKEVAPNSDVNVEELLKQLQEMKNELTALKAEQVQPLPVLNSTTDRMVKFINLTPGSAMLKGSAKRPYEIEGRYNSRSFTDTEAKVIVAQMGSYLREGFVYIDDADFVKEAGLIDAYRDMLTPDALKNLLSQSPDAIISAYEVASDGQKKIILDMIVEKKSKGENIDANILVRLGEVSGKDLMNIETEE